MGIDYGYFEQDSEELIISDRFANVGDFFNMAQVVSFVLPHIDPDNIDHAEYKQQITPHWNWLQDYIAEDPDTFIDSFHEYIDFTNSVGDTIQDKFNPIDGVGVGFFQADPDHFSPETKALLGRMIFTDKKIGGNNLPSFIVISSLLMQRSRYFAEKLNEDNRQDAVKSMIGAAAVLEPLALFAAECLDNQRTVGFHP